MCSGSHVLRPLPLSTLEPRNAADGAAARREYRPNPHLPLRSRQSAVCFRFDSQDARVLPSATLSGLLGQGPSCIRVSVAPGSLLARPSPATPVPARRGANPDDDAVTARALIRRRSSPSAGLGSRLRKCAGGTFAQRGRAIGQTRSPETVAGHRQSLIRGDSSCNEPDRRSRRSE